MDGLEDASTSGNVRVTRSLRKRLKSVDSESSSRPGTPTPAVKLETIAESEAQPPRTMRLTRRNSINIITTPLKTPIKTSVAKEDTPDPKTPTTRNKRICNISQTIVKGEDETLKTTPRKVAKTHNRTPAEMLQYNALPEAEENDDAEVIDLVSDNDEIKLKATALADIEMTTGQSQQEKQNAVYMPSSVSSITPEKAEVEQQAIDMSSRVLGFNTPKVKDNEAKPVYPKTPAMLKDKYRRGALNASQGSTSVSNDTSIHSDKNSSQLDFNECNAEEFCIPETQETGDLQAARHDATESDPEIVANLNDSIKLVKTKVRMQSSRILQCNDATLVKEAVKNNNLCESSTEAAKSNVKNTSTNKSLNTSSRQNESKAEQEEIVGDSCTGNMLNAELISRGNCSSSFQKGIEDVGNNSTDNERRAKVNTSNKSFNSGAIQVETDGCYDGDSSSETKRTSEVMTPDKCLRSGKVYGFSPTISKGTPSPSPSPSLSKSAFENFEQNAGTPTKLSIPSQEVIGDNLVFTGKRWSESVSGKAVSLKKIDAIETDKNSSLYTEKYYDNDFDTAKTADEINVWVPNAAKDKKAADDESDTANDISDDEFEEEPREKHPFVIEKAIDAGIDYVSGDSICEEERLEIEANEISMDGESLGSQDTSDNETDQESVESDSFIDSESNDPKLLDYSDTDEHLIVEKNKVYRRVQKLETDTSDDDIDMVHKVDTKKDESNVDKYEKKHELMVDMDENEPSKSSVYKRIRTLETDTTDDDDTDMVHKVNESKDEALDDKIVTNNDLQQNNLQNKDERKPIVKMVVNGLDQSQASMQPVRLMDNVQPIMSEELPDDLDSSNLSDAALRLQYADDSESSEDAAALEQRETCIKQMVAEQRRSDCFNRTFHEGMKGCDTSHETAVIAAESNKSIPNEKSATNMEVNMMVNKEQTPTKKKNENVCQKMKSGETDIAQREALEGHEVEDIVKATDSVVTAQESEHNASQTESLSAEEENQQSEYDSENCASSSVESGSKVAASNKINEEFKLIRKSLHASFAHQNEDAEAKPHLSVLQSMKRKRLSKSFHGAELNLNDRQYLKKRRLMTEEEGSKVKDSERDREEEDSKEKEKYNAMMLEETEEVKGTFEFHNDVARKAYVEMKTNKEKRNDDEPLCEDEQVDEEERVGSNRIDCVSDGEEASEGYKEESAASEENDEQSEASGVSNEESVASNDSEEDGINYKKNEDIKMHSTPRNDIYNQPQGVTDGTGISSANLNRTMEKNNDRPQRILQEDALTENLKDKAHAVQKAIKAAVHILSQSSAKKSKVQNNYDKRLPHQILEAIAVSTDESPQKKRKRDGKRQRHAKRLNKMVEEPLSPQAPRVQFKTAAGFVKVEPTTPPPAGFHESPITPRVRRAGCGILTAGQDKAPLLETMSRKSRKRKLIEEPVLTLAKPKWTNSGIFLEEKLPVSHSVARRGATDFMMAKLSGRDEKIKGRNKLVADSGGWTNNTAATKALDFKRNTLDRKVASLENPVKLIQHKQQRRIQERF